MRKVAFGIVGAIIAAGALYYGLAIYPQQRFQAALDQALRQIPAEYVTSYKTARYSWFDNRATLTGVAVQSKGPQSFDVAIDEVVLNKPSLDLVAAWSKAAANPAALTPDQALQVVDAVDVRGLAAHGQFAVTTKDGAAGVETVTVTAESTHVDGVRIYPWALLHAGIPSFGEAEAALAAAGPTPKLDAFLPMLHFEASLLLGFGYDGHTLNNLQETVKLEPVGSNPGMDLSYGFRRVSGGAFDRGIMKDGSLEGMTATYMMALPAQQGGTIAGTGTVDRVTMAGLDARKPLGQVLAGEEPAASMLDGLTLGRIEYDGMSILPAGATAPIALGSFALSDIAFSQGMPVSGRFAWDGLHLARAQISNPQFSFLMNKLGLDTLTVSIGASYKWDLDQKRIAIRDTTLKIDELGALDLQTDLSDIAAGDAWASQIRLAHALLHYHDATLTERAFRLAAAGADPAAFRQQTIATIEQQRANLGDNPERIAMSKAIVAFLTAPGSLTIELSPPSPVPFTTLRTAGTLPPPQLLSLIGLSVTSSP
jgi:hypothetical protein